MKKYEGIWRNMKKFFQIPGPRGKLGIFPSPTNVKKYEGNMKKCEGTMKKYENKDSPDIWAVGVPGI